MPQLNSWWNNIDHDQVYLLCSYNWNGYFYNLPWSSQLDDHYNSFGNGYVPYFSVIGEDYQYLHGSNNVSSAINSTENAIANMAEISLIDPISDIAIDANTSSIIDISGVFQHSQGGNMNYLITDNTNPEVCLSEISGTDIHLEAQLIGGQSQITVIAQAGNNSCEDTFSVTVNDIYPVPFDPVCSIEYPEVHLQWQQPQTSIPVTGWNIYRNGELINTIPAEDLYYYDQPGDGTYLYTVSTQYQLIESGLCVPVEATLYNTPGDIDGNGVIDCFDASLALFFVTNTQHPDYPFPWDNWRIERADIDGNGSVDAYDCSLILQYIVGIIYML